MQFRSIFLGQKDKICKRIHLGCLKGRCIRIIKVAAVIKTYFIERFAFQWIFISLSGPILTMSSQIHEITHRPESNDYSSGSSAIVQQLRVTLHLHGALLESMELCKGTQMCLHAAHWRTQCGDINSDSPFQIAHLVWLFGKPKVHINLINSSVAKNSFSNICSLKLLFDQWQIREFGPNEIVQVPRQFIIDPYLLKSVPERY